MKPFAVGIVLGVAIAGVLLAGCAQQSAPPGAILLNESCDDEAMLGQHCKSDSDCCPGQVCGIPLGANISNSVCGEAWRSIAKGQA